MAIVRGVGIVVLISLAVAVAFVWDLVGQQRKYVAFAYLNKDTGCLKQKQQYQGHQHHLDETANDISSKMMKRLQMTRVADESKVRKTEEEDDGRNTDEDDTKETTESGFKEELVRAKTKEQRINKAPQPTGLYGRAKVNGIPSTFFEVEDRTGAKFNQTLSPWLRFLEGRSILYCANAKAGTTTIHVTFNAPRCFGLHGCSESASNLFWQSQNDRDMILHSKPVSFTHVRNPWDRIWSTYNGKIKTQKIKIERRQKAPPTFVEFLDYVEENPIKNDHWQTFRYRCFPGDHGTGFQYDHILRVEDGLDEGLRQVMEDAGLLSMKTKDKKFGNTNHTVQARIEFYTQEAQRANMTLQQLVEKVQNLYQDDIEMFGYSFEELAGNYTFVNKFN